MPIRVLVVDDQKMMRQALKLFLADEVSVQVVGEAEDGHAALRQVGALQPDVVLMDVLMPNLNGVEATRQIGQRFPATKVLVLSVDDDQEYVAQALKYGAVGYLLKTSLPEGLAIAIQAAHQGYAQLDPGLVRKLIDQIPLPDTDSLAEWRKLTTREQQIVRLIAKGSSNQEIADTLFISEKTVRNHITHILSQLALRDRTQVAIFANTKISRSEALGR